MNEQEYYYNLELLANEDKLYAIKFPVRRRRKERNRMNALDRLRQMLDEANIPYESYCRTYADVKEEYPKWIVPIPKCEADRYFENQIIYGRKKNGSWLIDAIYKYGSYGRHNDMVETYGEYGVDKEGNPMVMSAEEAFEIISRLE